MNAGAGDVVLQIVGLSKSYGALRAVDDLTFEVRRGEIFGFLGPNGAGKTTTISMICGLLKSDGGEIRIDGLPLREQQRSGKAWMGLCPQNLVIWESLTPLEQLELMGRLYDLSAREAHRRALRLLDTLGLMEKKGKLARTLSGGMKRRLNLALALVHEPRILILDEPQAGLDPQSRILVREYIRSQKNGTTIILTTHEMDEADRLADRVAVIDHGRLLVLDEPRVLKAGIGAGDVLEITASGGQEGDLSDLQQDLPAGVRLLDSREGVLRFVGDDIPAALPQLLERFRARQIKIGDMTIRQKTLEDVFIALTGRRLRE